MGQLVSKIDHLGFKRLVVTSCVVFNGCCCYPPTQKSLIQTEKSSIRPSPRMYTQEIHRNIFLQYLPDQACKLTLWSIFILSFIHLFNEDSFLLLHQLWRKKVWICPNLTVSEVNDISCNFPNSPGFLKSLHLLAPPACSWSHSPPLSSCAPCCWLVAE